MIDVGIGFLVPEDFFLNRLRQYFRHRVLLRISSRDHTSSYPGKGSYASFSVGTWAVIVPWLMVLVTKSHGLQVREKKCYIYIAIGSLAPLLLL